VVVAIDHPIQSTLNGGIRLFVEKITGYRLINFLDLLN